MIRPITAQERIAARYIPAGFEVYRQDEDAIVYSGIVHNATRGDLVGAIAYRGSAMKHSWNYLFKSGVQLSEEVEKFFKSCAAHREYVKNRRSSRSTGETDTQKVKKALAAAGYPVVSVKRDRGTASHWINIVIDDYQSKPDEDGRLVSQEPEIMQIAKEASGRSHLHDDIQTDYFCVNISITFTKWQKCGSCVVCKTCAQFHNEESGRCGGYLSHEMAERQQAAHDRYIQEENRKKAEKEAYENSPEGIRARQEAEDLRKAEEYARECEINREKIGHPWVYDGQGNRDNVGGPTGAEPVKPGFAVKEIWLDIGKGKYFDSFKSATSYLHQISGHFPAAGGYDKINFRILFVDGENYSGRLDCKAASCPDNDLDVLKHILSHCTFYAGRCQALPDHIESQETYFAIIGQDPEKLKAYGDYIDRYLIPNRDYESGIRGAAPGVPA